ncbi:GAF domain-containing protein, partial [candidate division FCPU426 bacterium]|nr:GAF domain-containing protein [candidate division FCPU426 bacterium]
FEKKRIIIGAYIICAVMLVLLPTKYFVSHTVEVLGFKYFVGPAGIYYHLFPIFFVVCVIYSFYEIFKSFIHAKGLKRTQLRYLIIASIIGYTGGPAGFYPLYNIPIPPHSFYTVSIYLCIFAFTIIRYRLFDIEIILRNIYYHLIIFIASAIVISTLYILYGYFTKSPYDIRLLIIIIIGTLLVTSLFTRYHHQLDILLEKAINEKRRKVYVGLQDLAVGLSRFTEMIRLFDFLSSNLCVLLHLEYTAFYFMNQSNTALKLLSKYKKSKMELPISIDLTAPLTSYLTANNDILETEKYRHEGSYNKEMISVIDTQYNASLFIPLMMNNSLMGIIVLGYHVDRIGYTEREIDILRNVGKHISLVVENIQLHEKIVKENRLELIGTMAASLAHEIRNPLTSIKSFVEMLPANQHKPEFIQKFNDIVPIETERLLELTNSILNFVRNSEPCFRENDFGNIFNKAVVMLKHHFNDKNISVRFNCRGTGTVYADPEQMLQVLLNLLLNAAQASRPGSEINVELDNGAARDTSIAIADRGCGIPPQNIDKIFEPFYSTKIYGTGLGLANCRRIIESHHGTIHVESEMNQGTKIIINIPKKTSNTKP